MFKNKKILIGVLSQVRSDFANDDNFTEFQFKI